MNSFEIKSDKLPNYLQLDNYFFYHFVNNFS